ncbi:hypothetical protein LJ737_16130 [Hymenobacter sp. 15J16-1T3B]|uniref:hypothetical protein n=1 Tax=Hymenobacter sp. 15J16-1T3B TaxID=2886941 RepID=UPI001D10C927|nr:hypothetical protein [Hymenobacter sp. 15J16-1T3B]MCC3158773.1 hypothetical protein [Hymenobacter sp. 15J16-1T3B]
MKFSFRFPLLLLLVVGLLAGCSKDDDPLKGKLRYKVQVRVRGENLTGLGAEMSYATVRNTLTDPKPGPSGRDTYAVRADTIYELGEYGAYDALEVTLAMRNVTCQNAATQLGANSYLKAEILANGLKIDEVELNRTAARTISCSATPYLVLVGGVGGSGGDWDD